MGIVERLWLKMNRVKPEWTGDKNGKLAEYLAVEISFEESLKLLKSDRSARKMANETWPKIEAEEERLWRNYCSREAWGWINKKYTMCEVDVEKDKEALNATLK